MHESYMDEKRLLDPERLRRRKEAVRKFEKCMKYLATFSPVIIFLLAALVPGAFMVKVSGVLQKDWLAVVICACCAFFILIVIACFLHIAYMNRLHEYMVAKETDPDKRAALYAKYQKYNS